MIAPTGYRYTSSGAAKSVFYSINAFGPFQTFFNIGNYPRRFENQSQRDRMSGGFRSVLVVKETNVPCMKEQI